MKPVFLALVLLTASNALFAQTKSDKSAAKQLIQLEHDWSEADVKKDAAALNRILAEDWTGIDFEGTILTKAEVLRQVSLHSDATETESTELGDMKIRIFGSTALVSGTEIEKSEYKGEDSSGTYIWTDVFVRRAGRWQAVSSQSTQLVAREESPNLFGVPVGMGLTAPTVLPALPQSSKSRKRTNRICRDKPIGFDETTLATNTQIKCFISERCPIG